MKYAVIYKIVSPNNNIYIGQSLNFSRRFKDYENMRCEKQRLLYNSFLNYGFKNHKIEIVHKINTEIFNKSDLKNYLNKLESYHISAYKSFINQNSKGLNLTKGGDSNLLSDETKKKIGESNKGKKRTEEQRKRSSEQRKGKKLPKQQILNIIKSRIGYRHTEETKHKLSICKINEKNHNFGKKLSEETRHKMSQSRIGKKRINVKKRSKESYQKSAESNRGKKRSIEFVEYLRKINLGKKISDETKKKISEKLKGRKLSEENKNKISEGLKKRYIAKKLNNSII